MTNFERWQLLMRDVTSPQSFIDFGFYSLIAAALQRRVWTNAEHQKLYPNIYVVLVGPPGVGKGLILKPIIEMLRHHKLEPSGATKITNENLAAETVAIANYQAATATQTKKTSEKPLVLPVAANSITYEALVNTCAENTRRINYKRYDKTIGKHVDEIYSHASLCFALEEISSLFHKDSQKVVDFLITAYDCGDYHYKTKTQGEDFVKRCCLNFIGGTTPVFIETSFKSHLLTDGFSSRVWFIHGERNRFYRLQSPELSAEQLQAKQELIEHIGKLTKLYGYIPFAPDALAYLKDWWEVRDGGGWSRPNTSEKLDAYYSRKNIHVQKLALLMHLGEDSSINELGQPANPISLETCKRALAVLDNAELTMHLALNFDGENPLYRTSKKIMKYLTKNGPQTTDVLLLEFFSDVKSEELNEILTHLAKTRQIVLDEKTLRWSKAKE